MIVQSLRGERNTTSEWIKKQVDALQRFLDRIVKYSNILGTTSKFLDFLRNDEQPLYVAKIAPFTEEKVNEKIWNDFEVKEYTNQTILS